MWWLSDPKLRLLLLAHLAARLAEGGAPDVRAAGIDPGAGGALAGLCAADLERLAAMRDLRIGVVVEGAGLCSGLSALSRRNEARALETYFIRHGASRRLMHSLFKVRHKLTLSRRRECGAWRPAGRIALPDVATRERIFRAWHGLRESDPRVRYWRLHQAFPELAIAVLEAVLREYEALR